MSIRGENCKKQLSKWLKMIVDNLQHKWISIKGIEHLSDVSTSSCIPNSLGIYQFCIGEEVVYIGKAAESGRGFKKRIADYTRKDDSARIFDAGFLANKHQSEIMLKVLTWDNPLQIDALEAIFISVMMPAWNQKLEEWYSKHIDDSDIPEQIKKRRALRKKSKI